jgi:hypothetical protein
MPVTAGSTSIGDKSDGGVTDYTGVYEVTVSPELAGTSFIFVLRLNGLDVDATADYHQQPLVVRPSLTASALQCNYTILPLTSQFTT